MLFPLYGLQLLPQINRLMNLNLRVFNRLQKATRWLQDQTKQYNTMFRCQA